MARKVWNILFIFILGEIFLLKNEPWNNQHLNEMTVQLNEINKKHVTKKTKFQN